MIDLKVKIKYTVRFAIYFKKHNACFLLSNKKRKGSEKYEI